MNLHIWAKRFRCSYVISKLVELADSPLLSIHVKRIANEAIRLELESNLWEAEVQA